MSAGAAACRRLSATPQHFRYDPLATEAAQMRVMLAGIKGEFQEGHELDAKTARKVPKALIGKVLSHKEATTLLKKLE